MAHDDDELDPALQQVFRQEWGRLVATAARMVRDLDRAEELVQESLVAAVEHWRVDGLPERPGAWLMTTVRRRALDDLRRSRRARNAHEQIAAYAPGCDEPEEIDIDAIPDDRLRLIFTCCHPQLPEQARVALTLRLLGGLTTREIARAFLVADATISQRIVRAKKTIAERAIPYRVPGADELPKRLPAVLDVVYLIFNEGYAAQGGEELMRRSLCDEAVRLSNLLARLLPDQSEVRGLAALLEFQSSRHATRVDADGELVLLEDQDRDRWDRLAIERGSRHLTHAVQQASVGPYVLQAMIAECHARARRFEDTDWERIVTCYEALSRATESPVVELNHCVAVAMLHGPAAGLERVEALAASDRLRDYPRLPATRADLLRRLGRTGEAAADYRRAIELTHNDRERAYLERRLAECDGA